MSVVHKYQSKEIVVALLRVPSMCSAYNDKEYRRENKP